MLTLLTAKLMVFPGMKEVIAATKISQASVSFSLDGFFPPEGIVLIQAVGSYGASFPAWE
jgi:hypothetical protein